MAAWWAKHRINGNFYHLRRFTIPKTYSFTKPYLEIIETKYVERRCIEQRKRRQRRRDEAITDGSSQESTRDRIMLYLNGAGSAAASAVADALGLPVTTIRRQLARLAKHRTLVRTGRGCYRAAVVSQ